VLGPDEVREGRKLVVVAVVEVVVVWRSVPLSQATMM
jgi:hypothetical protein